MAGLQSFARRANHLLDKYTLPEIVKIAGNLNTLAKEMSSWDGIVCRRLAAMVDGNKEERAELALFLDRREGKSVERREVRVIRSVADLTEEELASLAVEGSVTERD